MNSVQTSDLLLAVIVAFRGTHLYIQVAIKSRALQWLEYHVCQSTIN